MIFESLNIFLLIGFLFFIWEYKLFKNYIPYFIFISIIIILLFNNSLWDCYFFNLESWKLLFLVLITFSFIIVFEIIKDNSFDVYSLLILVYIGSFILIVSDNLLTIYLGLELQTFSIFILIAKNRTSIKSSEAGLKYFMLGAISSGFYLLGLVILFTFGCTLELKDIIFFNEDKIILISTLLIIFSFFFKLTLFPLHFWIPDIYEGSSWDIITLISSLPKISVICLLIQLSHNSFIILIVSSLSIIIGTLGALNQSKLKRLLAYSGISHMGFTVLGFIIYSSNSKIVGSLYILIYIITILCILTLITEKNMNNKFIIQLSGIKTINKTLAVTLILLFLSIAGIPPLSGFLSKWFLIWMSIDQSYLFSSLIMVLFSIIGMGYYLRLVKTIYFQSKDSYFIWSKALSTSNLRRDFSFIMIGLMFFIILFIILEFHLFIDLLNFIFIK